RKRAGTVGAGMVDESARRGAASSGVYDYSSGEYVGESFEAKPLDARAPLGDEVSKALGNQANRGGGGFVGFSKRSAGDYTSATSSPYPSTGSFFAPTYATDPLLGGRRNLRLGPFNIGFGLNANFDYN